MIAIEAIKFNHNPGSATHDAFNIRRNATQVVRVPEWRRFISVNPEDSPAAYAVAPTQGNHIAIEVSLITDDPEMAAVEVRVENHVQARALSFTNGKTGFVSFELIDPPVARGEVGIWDLAWNWEWRLGPRHPWRHFDTTRHRIYVVLDLPADPWKQTPYSAANTHLPWTAVLGHACRWAQGATSGGVPRRPSMEAISAVSSPHTNAPPPAMTNFLCSADCVAERSGFEPSVQV
jgi:hypothetical protein